VKYYIIRFWLAISVSFYLFTPYLNRYTHEYNRFLFHWTRWDLVSLLFCIILLGMLFFFLFIILHAWGNTLARKVFSISFISTFGVALVANVNHLVKSKINIFSSSPWIQRMIWLYPGYFLWFLLAIFAVYASFRHTKKIKMLCITLCLIASPILPIFTFNALRYPFITSSMGSVPINSTIKSHNEDKRNVYIFIFDEWSYQRSFNNNELIPEFRNLKQFADQSTVFHNAASPWPNTFASIPSFLFQTKLHFTIKDGKMVFKDKIFYPLSQAENIFHHARELGFYTCIIGSYIPYGELLKDSVEFSKSISVAKRFGNSFQEVSEFHMLTAIIMLPDPFFKHARHVIISYFFNQFQIKRVNTTHELVKSIIQNQTRPTFAVFHYMIPHFPYVFNRDGHKKLFAIYKRASIPDYYGNLACLDEKIGEIISTLKESNKFDNSIIIMTSDHSLRYDPDYNKDNSLLEKHHIPLFIKIPYQKHSLEIDSKFNTFKLGSFINKSLDGDFTLAEVKSLLSDEDYFTPALLGNKASDELSADKR